MRKIYIRTSDIFDYKDAEKRMKHFDFCRKKLWNAVLYVVRILMA
jgi:hypothetical protein